MFENLLQLKIFFESGSLLAYIRNSIIEEMNFQERNFGTILEKMELCNIILLFILQN